MTINGFLEKIRTSGKEWELYDGKYIRIKGGSITVGCPLHVLSGADSISQSLHVLGLSIADASQIADAADNRQCSERLRTRMLEACGLKEADI